MAKLPVLIAGRKSVMLTVNASKKPLATKRWSIKKTVYAKQKSVGNG
jgi:hypothetical protein